MKNYYLLLLFIGLFIPQTIKAQNLNRVDVSDNGNLIGYYNTRYGYAAGSSMTAPTTLNYNTLNTFLGHYSGAFSNGTTASQNSANTLIGGYSGYNNTTGQQNSLVGAYAGFNNTSGINNSFSGYFAGYYNKTASNNTYYGSFSGNGLNTTYTAGSENTGLGGSSLRYITTGFNNIAVGKFSLSGTLSAGNTGNFNIGIGDNAGTNISSGDYNILIGRFAGASTSATTLTGNINLVIGDLAGYSLSIGSSNLLMGQRSGYNLTSSSSNIFIGNYSGNTQSSIANANNVFLGNYSGFSNSTGTNNTYLGHNSGYNSNAQRNTYVGANAGQSTTSQTYGDDNTALGYNASVNNYGSSNTTVGAFAGSGISSGSSNIMIGKSTGTSVSTGSNNVFIGTFANSLGTNFATISNSVALGSNAKVVRNNTISLGDTSVNMQIGIGTNWPTQRLSIKGNFSFVAYNDGMFYKNKRFLFQDEQENIALGTNHEEDFQGKGNLLIGTNSKLSQSNLNNSTAIGNGATVSVSDGLVLGNQNVHVGIGTSAPKARLEVASGKDGESGMVFSDLKQNNFNKFLTVNQLGQVVLEKPRTQLNSPEDWSDKVFEENYNLKSISEVEQFIKINKHLPNIPSAQEMTEKGIENDKLSAKLLEKIEELTLYLIEMKKENQELKTRLLKLESK